MKRQRIGGPSLSGSYHRHLLHAIGRFLPHVGLPLRTGDSRVRWTDRLLVVAAMLVSWQPASTLKDAFESCWHVVTGMYPSRRRGGHTYEGFMAALQKRSERLLGIVSGAFREAVPRVAGRYWKIGRWVVMGVDGSRIECPRTVANEAAFGCAGRNKTGPQQFLTAVLHVGTGLIWDWRRGGGKEAERNHLREMTGALPAGALLLADAGFTGYDLLSGLVGGGRSFIIRCGANVRLLKKLGLVIRENDGIVYLWPLAQRDREPLVLRLVVVHDGRKAVYLLTNVLEPAELSDAEVGQMYRRRWGLEVFYRSFKRTLEKHKLHSASPVHAETELDWAVVGLWALGLLVVQRVVARGIIATRWSVAESLRVVRRVMAGRGGRMAATDLRALAAAVKDDYQRQRPKIARAWPHKKTDHPPKPPNIRTAKPWERLKAQRVKAKIAAT